MTLAEMTAAVQAAARAPLAVSLPSVPGVTFHLRQITGAERDRYEIATSKNAADFRTRLLLLALSDDAGDRACKDSELATLQAWPADVVDVLFQAACRHNGMGADAERDSGNG
jgi:hypothetical protein